MRRALAATAAVALVFTACGPPETRDPGGADPATPAPTEPDGADGEDGEDGADGEGGEGGEDAEAGTGTSEVAAMAFTDCEAERYRVGYPADWETNDAGGMLEPCEIFHPGPIDEPQQPRDRDLHHAASVYVDAVRFDDVGGDDPLHEVIEGHETTVDGRRALVRELQATGDALLPEGERRYGYTVDLDGEVLVAVTHSVGDTDYERDKEILDRMVTEELTVADADDGT